MTFDISSLCAGATSGVATDQIGSLHRQETWPCKFFKPYLTLSVPREKKGSPATYIASKVPHQCAWGCRMQVKEVVIAEEEF